MSTLVKNMNIGPKFLIGIIGIAAIITLVGLFIIQEQESEKLNILLETRGKIVEAQTQITRAYIAQNYVGKIKKSKNGADIVVAKDHAANPDAIPFPATATREMGEEANKSGLYNTRLISQSPLNPANMPKDTFRKRSHEGHHGWSR